MSLLSEAMETLEALEVAKAASKTRAMVYDVATKEKVARMNGLSLDAYHMMPYADWIELRNNNLK